MHDEILNSCSHNLGIEVLNMFTKRGSHLKAAYFHNFGLNSKQQPTGVLVEQLVCREMSTEVVAASLLKTLHFLHGSLLE